MEINAQIRELIKQIVIETISQLVKEDLLPSQNKALPTSKVSILGYYKKWIDSFKKQVKAKQKAESTLRKHETVYKHLSDFMAKVYKDTRLAFNEVGKDFMVNFNLYLLEKGLTLNTRCVYLGPVQMIFKLAHSEGIIQKNPCADFHLTMEDKERGYLDERELQKIKTYECKEDRNETKVRDLFLFCCYTGLSYIDLKQLSREHLSYSTDGSHLWISTHRKKTGVKETVRLLPLTMQLLQEYQQSPIYNNVFEVPSLNTCNRIIKRIARQCGIGKKVTWHLARHTMATTVCLSHGVPIEAVAKILGHKKLRSTQIYANVTQELLNKEMDRIESSLI